MGKIIKVNFSKRREKIEDYEEEALNRFEEAMARREKQANLKVVVLIFIHASIVLGIMSIPFFIDWLQKNF